MLTNSRAEDDQDHSLEATAEQASVIRALAGTASPQERINALLAIGLTVEELSLALGVAENTVRNWADGAAAPRRAADRALDDLRTVVLALGEHGVESSRAVNWLRSRKGAGLGNQVPLELLRRDPLLVLAAAEEPVRVEDISAQAAQSIPLAVAAMPARQRGKAQGH